MENTLKERLEADLLIKYYGSRAAEEALAVAIEAFHQHDDAWATEALRFQRR